MYTDIASIHCNPLMFTDIASMHCIPLPHHHHLVTTGCSRRSHQVPTSHICTTPLDCRLLQPPDISTYQTPLHYTSLLQVAQGVPSLLLVSEGQGAHKELFQGCVKDGVPSDPRTGPADARTGYRYADSRPDLMEKTPRCPGLMLR